MSLQQDVDLLRNIPLFAKIEPSKLKLLAFTAQRLSFGEGDVCGVVRCDVVTQRPRTRQQIQVGVPVEVEVDQICDGFGRAASRHFA